MFWWFFLDSPFPVNRNVLRRIDSNANLLPFNADYGHRYIGTDPERLSDVAGNYKHEASLLRRISLGQFER